MRITKKLLKEATTGFRKRCKELCLMSEEDLSKEIHRCFPNMKFEGSRGELLNFMIQDLWERCIPDHWWQ